MSHTATLLGDGRVLIVGGADTKGAPLRSTELFDPRTGTSTAGPDLPEPRASHTATALVDGTVLIVGGNGPNAVSKGCFLFDPGAMTFTRRGNLELPRLLHQATLLSDGSVLVTGGIASATELALPQAEIFEPKTGKSRVIGGTVVPRAGHTATRLTDGRVLLVGGSTAVGGTGLPFLRTLEVFDPVKVSFEAVNGEVEGDGIAFGTASLLPDGRVLIVGAESANVYNPATDSMGTVSGLDAGEQLFGHMATLLPSGKVLLAGGQNLTVSLDSLTKRRLFDPNTDTFVPVTPLAVPRSYGTATLLPSGDVLYAGGILSFATQKTNNTGEILA